jgi:hypothetical protein
VRVGAGADAVVEPDELPPDEADPDDLDVELLVRRAVVVRLGVVLAGVRVSTTGAGAASAADVIALRSAADIESIGIVVSPIDSALSTGLVSVFVHAASDAAATIESTYICLISVTSFT